MVIMIRGKFELFILSKRAAVASSRIGPLFKYRISSGMWHSRNHQKRSNYYKWSHHIPICIPMAKAHWALESFFKALPNGLSQRGGQTDRQTDIEEKYLNCVMCNLYRRPIDERTWISRLVSTTRQDKTRQVKKKRWRRTLEWMIVLHRQCVTLDFENDKNEIDSCCPLLEILGYSCCGIR